MDRLNFLRQQLENNIENYTQYNDNDIKMEKDLKNYKI